MSSIYTNSLFEGLDQDQMDFVISKTKKRTFSSGEIIVKENSTGNSLFVLIKGEVQIEKELIPLIEGFKHKPDDKKIIRINDGENFYFGEMSLFDSTLKRTATIYSVTETELLELDNSNFDEIVSERKDIGVIILKNIGSKLSVLLDKSNVEIAKLITAFTISLKL